MKFSSFYYNINLIEFGYERDFNDTKMSVLKLLFSEVIQQASTNNLFYSLLINQQVFHISWGVNRLLYQRVRTSKCHYIYIFMQSQFVPKTSYYLHNILEILFWISNIIHMLLKYKITHDLQ